MYIFFFLALLNNLLLLVSFGLHLLLSSLSLSLGLYVLTWVQVLALPKPIPISPNSPIEVYLDCKIKGGAHQIACSNLFLVLFLFVPTRDANPHPKLLTVYKGQYKFHMHIVGLYTSVLFAFFSGQPL